MSQENNDASLCIENQSCFSLYSAANAMVRSYRTALLDLDLTYPQYLAMMVLWAEDGISVKALGEKVHMDSGTTTPLLKRLEGKGLLERVRCKQDERSCLLQLTDEGKSLKSRAQEIPKSMACQSPLTQEESDQLKALCDKLRLKISA
ncbi:MarR family transcriptional regulator [Pontibacterium sp. N1Y112]|jgi:DNA-binding MarR family transcriptional regulator|uniref:MarR family transcriptional regulator n=2 Tax=Pontibacterium TaxID=2036025 RepID=A0A8J7FAV5_9GAMM|nr:MarR family transcriptional regulator [Pontibacterium sinense]MBE9398185.1 MarR family transcriptional regulator [Pontibacterium sinense]